MKRPPVLLAALAVAALGAAGALAATAPAFAANLLTNPGFESGTLAGWSCTGGTGSVVGSPVHSGRFALNGAATTSDNATCSQTVTLQANHTYTLSAWVQGSYAFIGATTAAGDTSTFTPNASGYTRLSVTFSTTTSTSVRIWVHGWYGTGTVFVDDVSVS